MKGKGTEKKKLPKINKIKNSCYKFIGFINKQMSFNPPRRGPALKLQ